MPDIKSAWEIAQEKASKLGELSVEEREEQRQHKCRELGEALADKYLSSYDVEVIKDKLSKHDTSDKDLISRVAVNRLSRSIDLRYPNILSEISRGILYLENTNAIKQTLEEIKALFYEYASAEARQRQDIEKESSEILHQMRIAGTAIGGLNVRAKEEWQKKLDETALPFDSRLNALKRELQN